MGMLYFGCAQCIWNLAKGFAMGRIANAKSR